MAGRLTIVTGFGPKTAIYPTEMFPNKDYKYLPNHTLGQNIQKKDFIADLKSFPIWCLYCVYFKEQAFLFQVNLECKSTFLQIFFFILILQILGWPIYAVNWFFPEVI